MSMTQNNLAEAIETLTGEYRAAAVSYIEYLAREQKKNASGTLREIQSMFADDKGWESEEAMLKDMAQFRRERLSKYEY